jgi:hypothetical protein
MNREFEARTQAARLTEASRKVSKESMRVNAQFAAIEREPDAEKETAPLRVVNTQESNAQGADSTSCKLAILLASSWRARRRPLRRPLR